MSRTIAFSIVLAALLVSPNLFAGVLDKQKLLDAQTFWDNRDWDWYKQNIPFFECPNADIQTTYYYRWELLTKHLTYGSPNTGYVFTEFIDRPFWSGTYGAISCPAGHQLYEARWLRDPRYVRDYSRYWFHTPGAQPRRYSTWLADAVWADGPPRSSGKVVQNLVLRLRKVLGNDLIETRPGGYALRAPPEAIDALRFEQLIGDWHAGNAALVAATP